MPLFEAIRIAFGAMRVQKLKSFFSALGVTIAVTFLIAVVSIVSGMGRYLKDDLVGKIIGVNSFEVRQQPNIILGNVTAEEFRQWQHRPHIQDVDVDPVVQALSRDAVYAVVGQANLTVRSPFARERVVPSATVTEGYFTIKRMGVSSGRLISTQEYDLGLPVVVIGQDVADHFFPNLNPLGRELRIAGLPYTVVGIAEKQGSTLGISLDKFLVAPRKSAMTREVGPHHVVDALIVQSPTQASMAEEMERVRQVMRARHKLRPGQPDNFTLETSDAALEFWNKLESYLVLAGVALPAIGLIVGAIVIMNIMLVAVADRTREIGVRKSLGARRLDIMRQFLVEATALSTGGAALGVLLGIALAKGISVISPLPAAVAPWSIIVGVGVGATVGIIAGAYPASRAARLDPITALRQE